MFETGKIVVTPEFSRLQVPYLTLMLYLRKHKNGQFGIVSNTRKNMNLKGIRENNRTILSTYLYNDNEITLITHKDRSTTTFLLNSEFEEQYNKKYNKNLNNQN